MMSGKLWIPVAVFLAASATLALGATVTIEVRTAALMTDPSGRFVNRALFKFDLSGLPVGARIDRAVIQFPLAGDTSRAEQILRVWPAGVEWSGGGSVLPDADLHMIDTLAVARFCPGEPSGLTEVDITECVVAWLRGGVTNNGLVVESLYDGLQPVAMRSASELAPGVKAVVEVWYSLKRSR